MDVTCRLRLQLEEATENTARVRVIPEFKDDAEDVTQPAICKVSGSIYGPRCVYARTLPTAFALHGDPLESSEAEGQSSAIAIIPEPCYWTSELPFLYEARLKIRRGGGELQDVTWMFGMRRVEVHGGWLRLERRRTVLRGAIVESANPSHLEEARSSDSTLVVTTPSTTFLNGADSIGVKLLVDLRDSQIDLTERLREYSWHPSVHGVLIDDDRAAETAGSATPAVAVIPADSDGLPPIAEAAPIIAVELREHERPPSWIAALTRPVIAIRRIATYAHLPAAREAADRLQAALAPEFDLAGYFVGPVRLSEVAT